MLTLTSPVIVRGPTLATRTPTSTIVSTASGTNDEESTPIVTRSHPTELPSAASGARWGRFFHSFGLTRMNEPFADFDLSDFWEDSDYATREYVGPAITDLDVARVEKKLGYKLPKSYIKLMRTQNGGIPKRTNHRTSERTSWAEDHIAITGIYSIGNEKTYSLCGEFESSFWVSEWGYPPIGIYFANCPSAGHDMLCLDYRECGPTGEPRVVHIDQERYHRITFVAKNFESFVRCLEGEDAFET